MADTDKNTSNIHFSVPFTQKMLKQSPVANTNKQFPNLPQFFQSSMMPKQIFRKFVN
jgi:hypothetical protein